MFKTARLILCLLSLTVGSRLSAEESEIFPPPPEEEAAQQPSEPTEIPPPSPGGQEQISPEPAGPSEAVQEVQQAPQAPAPAPVPAKPKRLPPELARITVRFSNASLSTFLKAISQQTKVNFIIAEGLESKKITAFLDGVTLEEALQVILGIKGLSYEKIPGKTHTYLITPRKEQKARTITRIFELNYIPLQEIQLSGSQGEEGSQSASGIILGGQGDGKQDASGEKSQSDTLNILSVVKTLLSDNGKIALDNRTNSLIITDLPERFPQIEALIRDLDRKSPQVMIEAQMVEITSNGLQQMGLEFGGPNGELVRFVGPSRLTDFGVRDRGGDAASQRSFWANKINSGQDDDFVAPGAVEVGHFDPVQGISYGVLSFSEFQVLLRAIVTKSRGKVLSRPKIMTINNKPAEIRVTANEAIGLMSVTSLQGSVTSAERSASGLVLRVVPQVNADGYITMVVEPSVTRTVASSIGNFKDPVKRSVKSMIRVKNGSTIVVGGLIDTREEKVVRKVPILGYIPIIGWLFTSQSTSKVNTELAIFLTPTVVDN